MKRIPWVLLLLSQVLLGQFGPRQLIYEHPISGGRMIRTADFDNDGDQDVAIAITDFIAWYPNDGDGNFGEPITIDLDREQAFNLLALDVDGDSRIDLAVSYLDEDVVGWYRNFGGGSFSSRRVITSGLNNASGISQADIDDDGDVDFVLGVTNGNGLYWVEHLDGQGDFDTKINIAPSLTQARRQRLGDIDGDGDLDIVTNGIDVWMSWFENTDGQGDFSIQHVIEAGGLYENAFDIGDIDGDGDLDIISEKEDVLIWRENLDGLGNFSSSEQIDLLENVSDIKIVDIDNDGWLDVLLTSIGENVIAWYQNVDGQGSFGPRQLIETKLLFPRSVDTADLDSDGDLDVLVSTLHPEEIGSYWFSNLTILGVEEEYLSQLSLYPNPAQSKLLIQNNMQLEIEMVSVSNASGQLILEMPWRGNYIDISNWASGLYYVTVITGSGEKMVKKIIKD